MAYTFVAVFTFLWYLDFTWFREQFCNYLCPYARFQSALTDDETLLIGYDPARGEPREKGKAAAADGRCIECSKCVVVCPQGIDIRDGFQLECIQCARCIDACTSVMEKLGHRTLVEYTSMAELEGRKVRRLRPRTVVYGGLLLALLGFGFTLATQRVPFEVTVNRVPGSLFTVDPDGFVRNTYLLQLTNNDSGETPVDFQVTVEGIEGAEVLAQDVSLGSSETRTLPLIVRVPVEGGLGRTTPIEVRVLSSIGEIVVPTTFKTGASDDQGTG
jgi:cytochrome c oxidase accessory protein FixG